MDRPPLQQVIRWLYENAPAYYAETVEAATKDVRAAVAEEIAQALETYHHNADWAARIAREHGKES